MNSVSVRLAQKEDIPAIEGLIPESVRGLSQNHYTEQQIESALRYIFGVDSQLIADGTYYVAEIDKNFVGCGGWSKRKTLFGGDQTKQGTDPLLDPMTEPARIRAFYVHPAWARQGIGSRIMETCEKAALAAGFSRMELGATLPGVPLYQAFGFVPIEEIEAPMPDGVTLPIVRMGKNIGQD